MKSGTVYEQGEIVFVPFPFTDLSTTKKRPVLVLSKTEYNKRTEDFVTCGITSNIQDVEYSVLIDNSSMAYGTLPRQSRIKVDKIFTLEQSLVVKRLARVKMEVMQKVKEEMFKLV